MNEISQGRKDQICQILDEFWELVISSSPIPSDLHQFKGQDLFQEDLGLSLLKLAMCCEGLEEWSCRNTEQILDECTNILFIFDIDLRRSSFFLDEPLGRLIDEALRWAYQCKPYFIKNNFRSMLSKELKRYKKTQGTAYVNINRKYYAEGFKGYFHICERIIYDDDPIPF